MKFLKNSIFVMLAGLALPTLSCAMQTPDAPVKAETISGTFTEIGNNLNTGVQGFGLGATNVIWMGSKLFALAGNHPSISTLLTSTVALTSLYAWRTAKASTKIQDTLEKAKKITKFMDENKLNRVGNPNYMLGWHYPSKQVEFPVDILGNAESIHRELVAEKKDQTETMPQFRVRLQGKIDAEKELLNKVADDLEPHVTSTPFKSLQKEMHLLNKDDYGRIGQAIRAQFAFKLLNPFKYIKSCVWGSELEATQQYWKIKLLLARLKSLEMVVEAQGKIELNNNLQ